MMTQPFFTGQAADMKRTEAEYIETVSQYVEIVFDWDGGMPRPSSPPASFTVRMTYKNALALAGQIDSLWERVEK